MRDAEYQQQRETSVGYDGELAGEIFCTECGSVNEPSAETCSSCHAVLTEQGNHLSARLRRIRRRGSLAGVESDSDTEVIGADWSARDDTERPEPKISKLGTLIMMIGLGDWPIPIGVLFLLGVLITVLVIVFKAGLVAPIH